MMGKPTVAGTRITVELILEKLAAGETIEQILDAHPRLTDEGLRAAIAFAAELARPACCPRNPITMLDDLRALGVKSHSLTEATDTATPMGRANVRRGVW